MTNLAPSTETHPVSRMPRALVRAALAVSCLAVPAASHGQESGIFDQPRSMAVFDGISGYETFSPDRFGTLASPRSNELGFLLVLRMFRNVCLGLEHGAALDSVIPEGFTAYNSSSYYFGPDAPQRGTTTVLSSTGDIGKDEDGGNPAIWLKPGNGGMTCAVEWRIAKDMNPESRQAIADLLVHWVPWELALVRASRPLQLDQSALSDAIEWDRPCQGRWCSATAFFNLPFGDVTLSTTLNITDIEGTRP